MVFSQRISADLEYLEHDIDSFNYVISGNTITVEGQEHGRTNSGIDWPDGVVSQGRFCNVFEFDGMQIKRAYIYVDPDFANVDVNRIRILRGTVPESGSSERVLRTIFFVDEERCDS